jgi:hypothetical protein
MKEESKEIEKVDCKVRPHKHHFQQVLEEGDYH